MLFINRHSCHRSMCGGSTAGSDVIISASESMYSSSVTSLEVCANNSWNSVSIYLFTINISPKSNRHFWKHYLMVSADKLFQGVSIQVIAFNTWTSPIILDVFFPSSMRLTTNQRSSFLYLRLKFLMIPPALKGCML